MALATACAAPVENHDEPTQAALGPDGLVYVSDGYANAQVAVFEPDGTWVRAWGSKGFADGQFNTPHGIALQSDGAVLVADRGNARVQRFTAQGALLDIWYGPEIGRPWSVAVDAQDRVFVVDGGDQDPDMPRAGVTRLSADGQVQCRFSGYGAGPDQLDWGHMLTVTASRAVVVVDLNNERLLKFSPPYDPNGCDYSVIESWAPLPDGFQPLGVAAHAGRVYVSGRGAGDPILVLDEASGAVMEALAPDVFDQAHGLFADPSGLWVTDRDQDRVVRLGFDGVIGAQLGLRGAYP